MVMTSSGHAGSRNNPSKQQKEDRRDGIDHDPVVRARFCKQGRTRSSEERNERMNVRVLLLRSSEREKEGRDGRNVNEGQ